MEMSSRSSECEFACTQGPRSSRLHPPGVDMRFGGGAYLMRPEAADALTFGLVQLDRDTGMYRRVQLSPVDERMLIDQARDRERSAVVDQPAPWSSLRPGKAARPNTPQSAPRVATSDSVVALGGASAPNKGTHVKPFLIRDAVMDDARRIAPLLREKDKREIEAASGNTPRGLPSSSVCRAWAHRHRRDYGPRSNPSGRGRTNASQGRRHLDARNPTPRTLCAPADTRGPSPDRKVA